MILNFSQIKKEDIILAGGKAANLGELVYANVNVPKGFVLSSEAYKTFIRENEIEEFISKELLKAGNDKDKILKASSSFREKIINAKFTENMERLIKDNYLKLGNNKGFAIRSSATAEDLADASFAGQQETFLNVKNLADVTQKIRLCYASLWTDRAVSYRISQNYEQTNLSIAVIVQEMIESEKSGVLFTVNPINNKSDQVYIDASFGLGENVVSGQVNADNYILDKAGKILNISIGDKQNQIVYSDNGTKKVSLDKEKRLARVLSDEELNNLLEVGLKIENHYDYPMDIEWAINGGVVYILQARKITTLENKTDDEKILPYIKGVKIKKHNKALTSFLIEKIPYNFRAIEFDYFTAISSQKATIFKENGISISPNLIIDDDGIMFLAREKMSLNSNFFNAFKAIRNWLDFDYCAKMLKDFLEKYDKQISAFKDLDFENMDFVQCKDFIDESYELTKNIGYFRFNYGVFPTIIDRSLKRAIKRVNKNYTVFDLYWGLNNKTSVVEKDISKIAKLVRNDEALRQAVLSDISYGEIASKFPDFKALTDDFFAKNGFITDYISYCVRGRCFLENPDRIIEILKTLVNEDKNNTKLGETRDFSEIKSSLKKKYGKKYPKLEHKIDNFRYFHFVREESQYLFIKASFYLRKCLKRSNILLLNDENYELGISNLFHSELVEALNRGYLSEVDIEKISRRNKNRKLATKVWDASKLIIYKDKGDVLRGISASSGVVVARARIIKGPEEFYKMKKGDVLVCPFTAPDWTPLFSLASAVVADTGSALSHAAIVAREFGIPAVLGLGFACEKLKDGDMIRVDGDKGEIRVL